MPRKIKGPFRRLMKFTEDENKLNLAEINLPPPEELPCIAQVMIQNGVENQGQLVLGKVETITKNCNTVKITIVEVGGRQNIETLCDHLLSFRVFHNKKTTQNLFRVTRSGHLASKKPITTNKRESQQ